ncbi:MAG: hypothetical protein AAFR23_02185 [Pseudomonadota bacterium]
MTDTPQSIELPPAHPGRPDVGLAFNAIVVTNTLILDLLEWIGPEPRTASDVLDAWRTSCPRLTVWEDAKDLGLVTRRFVAGRGDLVELTDAGRTALADHRPAGSRDTA